MTTRPATAQEALTMERVPVAFCSRKLTAGQMKSWTPREKETYAIVLALQKWASWIGLQPVLVLTDHKSLESWAKEMLETAGGPAGRRARWHELFSRFDIEVVYIPGKENIVADALSRWAYPASKALADTNIHGSAKDEEEMEALLEQEREGEKLCREIHTSQVGENGVNGVEGENTRVSVSTRGGKVTNPTPPPHVDVYGNESGGAPDESRVPCPPSPPEHDVHDMPEVVIYVDDFPGRSDRPESGSHAERAPSSEPVEAPVQPGVEDPEDDDISEIFVAENPTGTVPRNGLASIDNQPRRKVLSEDLDSFPRNGR